MEIQYENQETHENLEIPYENLDNHENQQKSTRES